MARAQPTRRLPYFLCETVYVSGPAPWHIRPVGPKGRCGGGGADTQALCGRDVAWDVACDVSEESLARVQPCQACAAALDS